LRIDPAYRNVEGVVLMTLDTTRHRDELFTAESLFSSYAVQLFTRRSGMSKIRVERAPPSPRPLLALSDEQSFSPKAQGYKSPR